MQHDWSLSRLSVTTASQPLTTMEIVNAKFHILIVPRRLVRTLFAAVVAMEDGGSKHH